MTDFPPAFLNTCLDSETLYVAQHYDLLLDLHGYDVEAVRGDLWRALKPLRQARRERISIIGQYTGSVLQGHELATAAGLSKSYVYSMIRGRFPEKLNPKLVEVLRTAAAHTIAECQNVLDRLEGHDLQ